MRNVTSTSDFSNPLLLGKLFPFRSVHAYVRGGVLIRVWGAEGKQWKGAKDWGVNSPYRRAGVEDHVGFRVTQVVQVHSCQKETDSLTLVYTPEAIYWAVENVKLFCVWLINTQWRVWGGLIYVIVHMFNLSSGWRSTRYFSPTPLYSCGRETSTNWTGGLVGSGDGCDHVEKVKLSVLTGNEPESCVLSPKG